MKWTLQACKGLTTNKQNLYLPKKTYLSTRYTRYASALKRNSRSSHQPFSKELRVFFYNTHIQIHMHGHTDIHKDKKCIFTSSSGFSDFLLVGQNPSWHRPAAISPKWRQKIKLPRDACCAIFRRTLQLV